MKQKQHAIKRKYSENKKSYLKQKINNSINEIQKKIWKTKFLKNY